MDGFQESKLFEELFEQIVLQCVEVGLVQGRHLSVDGSFVEADAAKESRIPRQQLASFWPLLRVISATSDSRAIIASGLWINPALYLVTKIILWKLSSVVGDQTGELL